MANNINVVYRKVKKMVRYSDELLDEIKSRNDIYDVVSQYVALKRKGRNYFGVCPFHNEKSPSLSVSPDKQIFHCFGCGVGGNVLHFISKIENISFVESVQLLAERAGVELPKLSGGEDEKTLELKKKVYDVNKAAAEFYHENLYKPTSKEAQNYIKKRKLGNNTLKSFLIGYAGTNNELLAYLKAKGFKEEEMLASCLIGKSQKGNLYDKFRDRIMFPIQDTRNRVIAFGGRVLISEAERKKAEQESGRPNPKYINSPENIVYSKGRNLFGLNVARRGQTGMLKRILIVEGYMDAISLYQRGITNVVASLGTALTDNQARLLRKSSEQVILGYDADGAGQAAIIRAMDILKSMDVDIRVLQLNDKECKDPDEYILKNGPERFKKCMDDALSVVEYKIKVLKQNLDLENINDKIKFLNEIAEVLSKVENTMERELYIDKISKTYNISKEAIYGEVNKRASNKVDDVKVLERNRAPIIKKMKEVVVDETTMRREKMLIYLLINNSAQSLEKLKEIVKVDLIKDEENREIISTIYERSNTDATVDEILDWFDEEEVNYLSGIIATDFEINDVNKAIEDIEKLYLKEGKIAKRDEIIEKLSDKENLSEGEITQLEKDLNDVIIEIAKMR